MLPKIIMEHILPALMNVSKFDFIDAIGNYYFKSLCDTEILMWRYVSGIDVP